MDMVGVYATQSLWDVCLHLASELEVLKTCSTYYSLCIALRHVTAVHIVVCLYHQVMLPARSIFPTVSKDIYQFCSQLWIVLSIKCSYIEQEALSGNGRCSGSMSSRSWFFGTCSSGLMNSLATRQGLPLATWIELWEELQESTDNSRPPTPVSLPPFLLISLS